jgi:hypothetical protein
MTLYEEVVEDVVQTSEWVPSQWEGTLKDGRQFYFRYRGGVASLGIGASRDEAILDDGAWLSIGDSFDGYMEEAEFKDTFGVLYQKHEKLNWWVVTASQAFPNGEVAQEVWGTFMTKAEADIWIEDNKTMLLGVGNNIQVKMLHTVGNSTDEGTSLA